MTLFAHRGTAVMPRDRAFEAAPTTERSGTVPGAAW